MRRALCLFCVLTLLFLCGCRAGGTLAVTAGEIVPVTDGAAAKFTVQNTTAGAIQDLTVTVVLLDADGKEIERGEATYPLQLQPQATATVSMKSKKPFAVAQAAAYAYTDADGDRVSHTLPEPYSAQKTVTTTTDGVIRTRAELAEKLIDDVKAQFRRKGYTTDGSYDAENKQLIFVSYYGLPYEACRTSNAYDPETWAALAESMASMSRTCMEEFQRYGFQDVQTSIGLMSSDDEIILAVTDGEITQTLSS